MAKLFTVSFLISPSSNELYKKLVFKWKNESKKKPLFNKLTSLPKKQASLNHNKIISRWEILVERFKQKNWAKEDDWNKNETKDQSKDTV